MCETLKYRCIIDEILKETKLQQLETNLSDVHLVELLVYDFLFGKGISTTYHLKVTILCFMHSTNYNNSFVSKALFCSSCVSTVKISRIAHPPLLCKGVRSKTCKRSEISACNY